MPLTTRVEVPDGTIVERKDIFTVARCGLRETCALRSSDGIWRWGRNGKQLGTCSTREEAETALLASLEGPKLTGAAARLMVRELRDCLGEVEAAIVRELGASDAIRVVVEVNISESFGGDRFADIVCSGDAGSGTTFIDWE